MDEIKALKDKLYNSYGIVLKEDDPAWLMILIYNDLLQEVNRSIDDLQNMPKITQANESILTALSQLQLKASDSLQKVGDITGTIEAKNKVFINDIASQIEGIDSVIKQSINSAVNNIQINTSPITNAIDKKIKNFEITDIETYADSFNDDIKTALKSLNEKVGFVNDILGGLDDIEKKTEKLEKTANDLSSDLKKINWVSYATIGIASFAIGTMVGMGFLFTSAYNIADDVNIKKYDKKIELLNKKEGSIKELGELYQWLYDNQIEVHHGRFSDTKEPFISVDKDDRAEGYDGKYSFSKEGTTFIRIKPIP